jgi:hypothetical protein
VSTFRLNTGNGHGVPWNVKKSSDHCGGDERDERRDGVSPRIGLPSPYSGADVPRRTDGAAGRFSPGVMYQSMNRFVASGGLSPAFNSLFDGLAGPRQ